MLLGPIASSVTGECFNLLSEEVATQLAIKLGADKLIGFCSEQGVIDDNGNAVAELFPIEAEHVIKKQKAASAIPESNFDRHCLGIPQADYSYLAWTRIRFHERQYDRGG